MGGHHNGNMLGVDPMVHDDGRAQEVGTPSEGRRHNGGVPHARSGGDPRGPPDRPIRQPKAVQLVLWEVRELCGAILRLSNGSLSQWIQTDRASDHRCRLYCLCECRHDEFGLPRGEASGASEDDRGGYGDRRRSRARRRSVRDLGARGSERELALLGL